MVPGKSGQEKKGVNPVQSSVKGIHRFSRISFIFVTDIPYLTTINT